MLFRSGSGFGKGAAIALAERGHEVIATTETDEQAAALRAEAPTPEPATAIPFDWTRRGAQGELRLRALGPAF